MIRVKKIESDNELKKAFAIREKVFVEEQNFKPESEFDEKDDEANHFLAFVDGEAVGTSRWRKGKQGIKVERFAVLKPFRGKGVGKALVQTTVTHVLSQVKEKGTKIYLNAHLHNMPLYEKYGFERDGDSFTKFDIKLIRMIRYV